MFQWLLGDVRDVLRDLRSSEEFQVLSRVSRGRSEGLKKATGLSREFQEIARAV